MNTTLKTTSLTKEYAKDIGAVGIDLELHEGEIVGFVGANGAGKTTTLLMMAGLIRPDSGKLQILGMEDVNPNNISQLMPELGILMADVEFEPDMSARQIFTQSVFMLGIRGHDKFEKMSKELDLPLDVKFKNLSTGNRKKVGVVNALFHEPKVVIMDEPSSGLDPLIQKKLDALLLDVRKRGGTVLLSSHNLDQVEQMCDRIVIIRRSQIILDSEKHVLLDQTVRIFRVRGQNLPEEIRDFKDIEKKFEYDNEIIIYTKAYEDFIMLLAKNKIHDFLISYPKIEELFIDTYK